MTSSTLGWRSAWAGRRRWWRRPGSSYGRAPVCHNKYYSRAHKSKG